VNGRPLDDPAYLPLFEKAAELDVPLFLHPTNPASIDAIADYRLTAILGFLFDTTVAVTRLVFAGVLEKAARPQARARPPGRHDAVRRRARRSRL
jgi:aminocarboxymuconate-semialdehyde decarboxylase